MTRGSVLIRRKLSCKKCGRAPVRITNSKSRYHPHPTADYLRIKRQECVCQRCGYRWWREVRITETEVK